MSANGLGNLQRRAKSLQLLLVKKDFPVTPLWLDLSKGVAVPLPFRPCRMGVSNASKKGEIRQSRLLNRRLEALIANQRRQ
jgi:hypothetical protein